MACDPIRLVPGPPGQDGAPGTNGTDGANAFTTLTEEFTMPAEGGTDTAVVADTSMLANGSTVYIPFAGTLQVNVVVGPTEVILKNIAVAADGIYPDNSAAGSIIPSGSEVVPTGLQGPAGAAGTNGTNGTNGGEAFSTLAAQFTMPAEGANFLTDLVSTAGFAVGQITFLEGAGHLQVVSITDATQLTLQNLENTAASQYLSNAAPGTIVAIGAKLVSAGLQGPQGATGATGAAGAAGAAGATGASGSLLMALYQNIRLDEVTPGAWLTGAWATHPLNTEVTDVGNIGTLLSNQVTLVAGTYRARWRMPGYFVGSFMSRLQNLTDTISYYGDNGYTPANTFAAYSEGEARFTIAASKVFEVQGLCSTTNNTNGLGLPNSLGVANVYATLEFLKES